MFARERNDKKNLRVQDYSMFERRERTVKNDVRARKRFRCRGVLNKVKKKKPLDKTCCFPFDVRLSG